MKILLFLYLFSLNLFGQVTKIDKKLIKVINRELKAATQVLKRKKSSKNYLRVYNSRIELLNFMEKELRTMSFSAPNSKNTKNYKLKIRNFYKKTYSLGEVIVKKYKRFSNMGNFYFLHSLLLFEYQPSSKKIEKYLQRSIKNLKNLELKSQAEGKLADYYFKNKDYKRSQIFYEKALKDDSNSRWKDRFLYNKSFTHFKLEEFQKAIDSLFIIQKESKDKTENNYYYVQALKRIPDFFVYANRPDDGFNFLLENLKELSTKRLFEFVKFTYNKGFFLKYDSYVRKIYDVLKNDLKDLTLFQLEQYSFLTDSEFKKNYSLIKYLRSSVVENHKFLSKKEKEEFKGVNKKSLSGNFYEINKKDFNEQDSFFKPLLDDTESLLQIMTGSNPKKRKSYEFRLAQIYKLNKKESKSFNLFEKNYLKVKNEKFREKSLDEMVSLIGKNDSLVNLEKKINYFKAYLKEGSKKKIKNLIRLKLYDHYYSKKDFNESFNITKDYFKSSLGVNQTELMLTKIISQMQLQGNTKKLSEIQDFINGNETLKRKRNLKALTSNSYEIVISRKINDLINDKNSDVNEVIDGLEKVFYDKKISRVNRFIALFNSIVIANKNELHSRSLKLIKVYLSDAGKVELDESATFLSEVLYRTYIFDEQKSLGSLKKLSLRSCFYQSINKENTFSRYLEMSLGHGSFSSVISREFKKCGLKNFSKLYALIYEYTDLNNSLDFNKKIIFLKNVYGDNSTAVNSILIDYIGHKLNNKSLLKNDLIRKYNELITFFNSGQLKRNQIVLDLLKLGKISNYSIGFIKKEPRISFENYLELNLKKFSNKLTQISNVNIGSSFVRVLKSMVQAYIFEDLITFFNGDSLILDANDTALLSKILTPFIEKYKSIKSALIFSNEEFGFEFITFYHPKSYIFRELELERI